MSLVYFLHSPASDSGSFLLYPQVRKPWSHLPSARLGESLQVFHLLADPFSPASQLLPIHRVCNNECDLGEEERSLGETTGLSSGDRAGLITTWGKGAMGVVKKFLFQNHIFIKSYSLGAKRTKNNTILSICRIQDSLVKIQKYRNLFKRNRLLGVLEEPIS